jgi:WD40 repeat protein
LQVVTGNPGSGKTAVLGLIAALADSRRRATVPLHGLGLPVAAVPDVGVVNVAIYAQGLTTDEVLAGVAAAVHSRAGTPGQLLEELTGRDTPLTVLIDALDEAADPHHLIRRLLGPLIEHAAGKLRLLVGTRDFLLERLGLRRGDAIDLDAGRYADLPALTTYAARGLLEASPGSPYLDKPAPLIRGVADAVAEAAHPSFLVARITSATLAAQAQAADAGNPAWRQTLPRLPGDAMRRDLEARLGDRAAKVRDLLLPLAFAEGQGLPWEDIWAAAASRAAGTTYTDDDLMWLREHAGSYVVEATESDRSTYRLYHQALADHLREGVDTTAMHTAIAEVLVTRVPRTLEGRRDWTRAHPYTLRHLATHAALAGHIDTLVADADYLVHAEPVTLLLALHQTTTDTGVLTAAVYRCSADIHCRLSASRRRQVLATDASRFQARQLLRDLCGPLIWQPRWATGRQADHALHTTFTGHTDSVLAVACGVLNGRPVAITGSDDNTARLWDLAAAKEITIFAGHSDSVRAVACSALDKRPVVVTASDDNTARVWDLATGKVVTTFTGHTDSVLAVACCMLDDRAVAVTASDDNTARVWDLATGKEVTTFTGHAGWVWAVACCILDDRPIAITAGHNSATRVWDLAAGEEIATFASRYSVLAVACGVLDGRPVAVTAGEDNTAHVWDLATGEEVTTFTGHTDWVQAVACSALDDRAVAVTASDDNTARVWDLATGEEVTTFTGHTDWVRAVACGTLDGRPVAIATDDDTARVWRFPIEAAHSHSPTHPGHSAHITAATSCVLDGRSVAVTTSDDNTARVWDLATGQEITTFTGHSTWVIAVACSALDNRPVAVTASGNAARVWDLSIAKEIATFAGHTRLVAAVACSVLDNRPVAVTASADETARVWDLARGDAITTFTGHVGWVRAVTCSVLDGRPVAVTAGDDKTARVWDLATGKEIATFAGHTELVTAVACSVLDDRPVAVTTSNDNTARVWDLATGEQIITFAGHTASVRAVVCGVLDNRPVAITISNYDNTVRVWILATGDQVHLFDLRSYGCVAIGPGRELMITTGWDLVVLDRIARN